jgi:hypothetical protein
VEDMPLVVTIVRGPYWESTTVRDLPDAAPSAAACVVYDYTAAGDAVGAHDIVGDVGARIRFLSILGGAGLNYENFWLGIRSANKHGASGIANFEPVWELEDGDNFTDVTDTVDAGASGGYMVRVSESSVNWDDGSFHDVNTLLVNDTTVNIDDQFGQFLCLLRGNPSGSTWEIRMVVHAGQASSKIFYDPVEMPVISGYAYVPLGIVEIPRNNTQSINKTDFTGYDAFQILTSARRTSGSNDLDLDCLVLIPVDEGFLSLDVDGNTANVDELFGEGPSGEYLSIRRWIVSGLLTDENTISGISNFRLPPGDGRIYCVYAEEPDTLSNTITFNDGDVGKYYERWLSLQGKDGTDIDFSVSDGITLGDTETVSIP